MWKYAVMTNILLTPLIEGSLSRCETISYPCLSMVCRCWCGRFDTLRLWWQTEIRTRVSERLHGTLIIIFLGCGSESHLVLCLLSILIFRKFVLPALWPLIHVLRARYGVMIHLSLIRCPKDAATSEACRWTMRVVWPPWHLAVNLTFRIYTILKLWDIVCENMLWWQTYFWHL